MSQLKITNAGAQYKDEVFAGQEVQNITHFLFCNVPNLLPTDVIDLDQPVPTANVVHSQPVDVVSRLNDNAVVISTTLGYDVGDFDFNWYGAVATKADGSEVLIAVVQTPLQTKTKTVGLTVGNYSVKSVVWRTSAIAQSLNISLGTLPWQVHDNEFVTQVDFDAQMLALNSVYLNKGQFSDLKSGRKNHIVDGRFDFWYEGTSQTSGGYGSDTMWNNMNSGSTKVHARQSLVLGVDIPEVPTAKFYSRTIVTSVVGDGNYVRKYQRTELVGTLAGKTVTVSFYARADATKNIAVELVQGFGTGGSPSAAVTGIGSQEVTLTTSFKRYTLQINVPSIQGKSIGTNGNDYFNLAFWFDAGSNYAGRLNSLGHQSGTFDIACVQVEEGSVATAFDEEGIYESNARVGHYFLFYSNLSVQVLQHSTNNTTFFGALNYALMRSAPVVSADVYDPQSRTSAPRLSQSGSLTFGAGDDGLDINLTLSSANTSLGATIGISNLKIDARL